MTIESYQPLLSTKQSKTATLKLLDSVAQQTSSIILHQTLELMVPTVSSMTQHQLYQLGRLIQP